MSDSAEAMFAVATAPVWVPLYVVYLVLSGVYSAGETLHGTVFRAKPTMAGAYTTEEEARQAASRLASEYPTATLAVVKAMPQAVIEQYGKNSPELRNTKYKNIMAMKTNTNDMADNTLAYRNLHQKSLMEEAYGNLGGGRRSKNGTIRRRNGRKSARR